MGALISPPGTAVGRLTELFPYMFFPGSEGSTGSGGTGGSSVGSTPASTDRVAYQSATWVCTMLRVPRTEAGTTPPEMKAADIMPPFQLECFSPLR